MTGGSATMMAKRGYFLLTMCNLEIDRWHLLCVRTDSHLASSKDAVAVCMFVALLPYKINQIYLKKHLHTATVYLCIWVDSFLNLYSYSCTCSYCGLHGLYTTDRVLNIITHISTS